MGLATNNTHLSMLNRISHKSTFENSTFTHQKEGPVTPAGRKYHKSAPLFNCNAALKHKQHNGKKAVFASDDTGS